LAAPASRRPHRGPPRERSWRSRCLQVLLGFANMLLLAPVWMQLVHLAVADALFMSFVWLALAALYPPGDPLTTP
jgi:heme A synthase